MTEQSQSKRADELVPGDRVMQNGAITTVTYGQTTGATRLTVFADGSTWQSSLESLRKLVTDDEMREQEQAAERDAVADSLVELAGLIRSVRLPIGYAFGLNFGALDSRAELDRWVAVMPAADVTMSGKIPVAEGHVGKLRVRGQCSPDPEPAADVPPNAGNAS